MFAAGESLVSDATSQKLASNIKLQNNNSNVQLTSLDELAQTLSNTVQEGDIVLMQGAGSIGMAAQKIAEGYS